MIPTTRAAHARVMDTPPHPHTGLQTVSWLYRGEIEHRDSAGHHALIHPAQVNLMLAGVTGKPITQTIMGATATFNLTPTYINFFCYWMFQIPLAYVLAFQFGLKTTGVLLAVPIAEAALAATSIVLFRRGKWKLKQV